MSNPIVVAIPKVGTVQFPFTMNGKSVNEAVRSLHSKAVIKSVLRFVAKDPALTALDTAGFYKELSVIAAFLEKYTTLARAADAGILGTKMADIPTVDESLHAPIEQPEPEPEQAAEPEAEPAEAQPEEAPAEEAEAEPTEGPTK